MVLGCYRIDFRSNLFSIPHSDEAECQKKCNGTIFFAVKVRHTYVSFVEQKQMIGYLLSTSYPDY